MGGVCEGIVGGRVVRFIKKMHVYSINHDTVSLHPGF